MLPFDYGLAQKCLNGGRFFFSLHYKDFVCHGDDCKTDGVGDIKHFPNVGHNVG